MSSRILKIAFFGLLLLVWQIVHSTRSDSLVPSPMDVATTMWNGFAHEDYHRAVLESLRRLAIGYGLSVGGGLLLGLALSRWKALNETVGSLVLAIQTLPSICWMPLAVLWFGLNDRAILFVVVIGSILSITIATRAAVARVPVLLVRAARTMGASEFQVQRRVILPAALPALVEGMKLGWSFAWRSLMGGELLFATFGLGQLMSRGRELNDMSRVIAVMLMIILLGLLTERLVFSAIERRLAAVWGFQNG